jgi:hypothetical protein
MDLDVTMRRAPVLANLLAIADPNPPLAPVMSVCFLAKEYGVIINAISGS